MKQKKYNPKSVLVTHTCNLNTGEGKTKELGV